MSPEGLWALSRLLHQRGNGRLARLVKAVNYLAFRCVLPPEVDVDGQVVFLHHALGVVIDPDIRIIGKVMISHGVTIGAGGGHTSGPRVILNDGAFVGAGATIIAPAGRSITIGEHTAVGANSHVFQDVAAYHRVGASAAQTVRVHRPQSVDRDKTTAR